MQIYWIKDRKKQHPTSVSEIISMLQRGDISDDTLGWHKGCEKWIPIKDLPALQSFFNKPEEESETPPIPNVPLEEDEELDTENHVQIEAEFNKKELEDKLQSGSQLLFTPSPIQRFLARILDCTIYAALYMAIIYWREIPFDYSLIPNNPLIWLGFIPLEAALLSHFGTTPGKALFGMKLYSFTKERQLGVARMLRRSFLVFALGMGMMLMGFPFPLTLLALFLSYRRLTKEQITIWDARVQTILLQRKAATRARCFLAAFLIYICINFTSFFMQPWLPSMLQDMKEISPEAAESLEKWMPAELLEESKATSKSGDAAK